MLPTVARFIAVAAALIDLAMALPPPPCQRHAPADMLAAAGGIVHLPWNPAGGLRHHLAAWRWRSTLWAPFRAELAAWLDGWRPQTEAVVLVGPSAGWTLPPGWLGRFDRVLAVEPDPVARWLFARRFPGVAVRWLDTDYLTPEGPLPWRANTARLFAEHSDAAIVFCNVLGQLPGLWPRAVLADDQVSATPAFERWKLALRGLLLDRPWLSWHDRLSCEVTPHPTATGLAREVDLAELVRLAWPAPDPPAVYDHLTGGLQPDLPRRLFVWQRTPGVAHLVEGIGNPPAVTPDCVP